MSGFVRTKLWRARLDTSFMWLPWRWRKHQADPRTAEVAAAFGMEPVTYRQILHASWFNFQHNVRRDLRHAFLCKPLGHARVWHDPTEFDWDGHWGCRRCPSWYYRDQDRWVEVW